MGRRDPGGISRRILFLVTGLGRGGAETQVFLLASGLKGRGWEVRVVSMVPPEDFVDELRERGILVDSLSMTRGVPDPRALWHLARIVREFRPTVLHAHMIHANLLGRLVRLVASVPVLVCTAQNTFEIGRFFRTERSTHLVYRLTDFLCDLTTQVSQEGYRRFLAGRVARPDKLRFVPNAVDTERFAPDPRLRFKVREELGISEDTFVWLAVGRLEEQKDYPTLLQAFARVVVKYPRVQLLIAGKGTLEAGLRSLAQTLGLERTVRFLGLRKDIPGLMNAADAFVMSSAWEGMPMVLLEAQATGLPVVATNVGGSREVVQPGISGFLVPPRDPDSLAGAMVKMTGLPEGVRRSMGSSGREWVKEHFSIERILDIWEELYSSILRG
ncbi:glycosyltransferase [Thermus antranikianii]